MISIQPEVQRTSATEAGAIGEIFGRDELRLNERKEEKVYT